MKVMVVDDHSTSALTRPWQDVAAELARGDADRSKTIGLVYELNRALVLDREDVPKPDGGDASENIQRQIEELRRKAREHFEKAKDLLQRMTELEQKISNSKHHGDGKLEK